VFLSLYIPVLGFYPLDHQVGSRAHEELTHKLRVIDNHLKGNNFLVGHSLTIADIHLATLIVGVFRFIYDEQLRKTVPNLVRWFDYVG
jgi:elongation factor 1-gamma